MTTKQPAVYNTDNGYGVCVENIIVNEFNLFSDIFTQYIYYHYCFNLEFDTKLYNTLSFIDIYIF